MGGQTVSEVGSAVTPLALPLLAVISLDATTFQVGPLTACTHARLPHRRPARRRLGRPVAPQAGAVWSDLGRMVVLGLDPARRARSACSTWPQLFVVAIVAGVLTVFFDVAYQSYLPVLVEPEQLVDANGKIGASQSFGQVAGPSFGGALVGTHRCRRRCRRGRAQLPRLGDPDRRRSAGPSRHQPRAQRIAV